MASVAQVNYMKNLAEKKVWGEQEAYLTAVMNTPGFLEGLNNNEVNQVLALLKSLPWKPKPAPTLPTPPVQVVDTGAGFTQNKLPAGSTTTNEEVVIQQVKDNQTSLGDKVDPARYFIVDPFDGKEKFVHITKPEAPSKWAGYTFVAIRASDDLYPVKDRQHKEQIFSAILNYPGGPLQSMNEYGIRLGVCGNCGRTLTDRDSRLRGIGPICAAKLLGQPTDEQLDILNKLGLRK